jgi:hypothetical protein
MEWATNSQPSTDQSHSLTNSIKLNDLLNVEDSNSASPNDQNEQTTKFELFIYYFINYCLDRRFGHPPFTNLHHRIILRQSPNVLCFGPRSNCSMTFSTNSDGISNGLMR